MKHWHSSVQGKDSATFEHQQHSTEEKGWGFWPTENTKGGEAHKEMPTCVVVR